MTLYKTRDNQIDQLRFELMHTTSYKESLVKRRDKCFQALVDLNVDRRIMLGKVGENRDILTQQYMDEERRNRARMAPHAVVDETLEDWTK